MSAFVWLGGALFVGALSYCGYSYAFTWSHGGPFSPANAVVDAVLFSVFALHHSVCARDSVKRLMSSFIPQPLLRSVYVWLASLLLIAVCVVWRPVGGGVYDHHGVLALAHAAIQLAGLVVTAQAVRTIDPLELAGIRGSSPKADVLQISGPYRHVRHPIYSGWLLLTFGAAHMTGDRLIFAGISTIYLLIAMPYEERSLRLSFGTAYDDYKRRVRYRIVPYVY